MDATIGIEKIREIADEYGRPCLIPVVKTVEGCADPTGVYLGIRRPYRPSYLLESAEGPGEAARYSIIGFDALLYVAVRDGVLEVRGSIHLRHGNKIAQSGVFYFPLQQLADFLANEAVHSLDAVWHRGPP